jgi:hypothetical protein
VLCGIKFTVKVREWRANPTEDADLTFGRHIQSPPLYLNFYKTTREKGRVKKEMIKMETENAEACPKCSSGNIKVTSMTYPKAYECGDCKYTFIKGKQALIDE